jgi:hypothetical protein
VDGDIPAATAPADWGGIAALRGCGNAAVDGDHGARQVCTGPAGEEHGDTRHVVVAADPP